MSKFLSSYKSAKVGDGKAWHVVADGPLCSKCMLEYVEARGEDKYIENDIEEIDPKNRICFYCDILI